MAINTGKYIEEVNLFINDVAQQLGNPDDRDHASRVITSVLHTLRERISVEESFHVISQLPMILKGIYVDGWDISKDISKSDTLEEFLDELRGHSDRTDNRDFGNDQQARRNAGAVLRVLKRYLSDGEIRHIKNQLPEPVAELFEE